MKKSNLEITENNINKKEKLLKEFKFPLGDEIYLIEIKVESENDILILKGNKKNISSNEFYEGKYSINDFHEMNEKYKEFKKIEDLFNFLVNIFFSKSPSLNLELNCLIISNEENDIKLKLEKNFDENKTFDDIFEKLSLLEEQINNFSNQNKIITNTLHEYESKLEKMTKK